MHLPYSEKIRTIFSILCKSGLDVDSNLNVNIIHTGHISQNSAYLEGHSHKKFKSHGIFGPLFNRFYEEININHTVMVFTSSLHELEDFRLYWGSSKMMFKKI